MSGKSGIVINLKGRDRKDPSRGRALSDPLRAVDDRSSASRSRSSGRSSRSPAAKSRGSPSVKGRSVSKRRRSPSRSPLPAKNAKETAIVAVSSKTSSPRLNKSGLEDIFARFHGEFDGWIQKENGKLERSESRGFSAREELTNGGSVVCEYLRKHAPGVLDELGDDPLDEMFASRALPRFLEMVEEDRKVLTDAAGALSAFAERRFPNDSDLDPLKADSSPLPLLRSLLRKMAEAKPAEQPAIAAIEDKPSGKRQRSSRRERQRSERRERQLEKVSAALSAPLPPALEDDGFVQSPGEGKDRSRSRSEGSGDSDDAASKGGDA